MSLRMEKVNKELQRKITEIIRREVDDPISDFLSITRVDTTRDLQESKVFFSLLDETKYEKAAEVLNKMNPHIRAVLGKKIHLKVIPKLQFIADESIKYSVDINKRIDDLKNGSQSE